MQAASLPITSGWLWIQNGFQLFKRQPMAMFFWSLMTGFLISVSYLIPLFGQMLLIAGTPILTFITLSARSEEHTSELQSLMRISYAVFCLIKKTNNIAHIVKLTTIILTTN